MSCFMQALESRRLLDGVHDHPAGDLLDCPEVISARQDLQAVMTTLRHDKRAGQASLADTREQIRDEMKQLVQDKGEQGLKDAMQPLNDKLRADEKAKFKELRNAGDELRVAKRDWTRTVAADLKAWRAARVAGDEDAATAAKEKLDADRQSARDALDPIREKILAIKDKWRPIIGADHDVIQDKLVELNPDLGPLFDKLDADAQALHDKLLADQQKVVGATGALADAIKDCREATASASA
jgi:hypothetical protein